MTLQDYVEDFFDLDITLMSDGELAKARASFDEYIQGMKKARASLSDQALSARSKAKAFGGRALTGTARQKEWAESIRADKLQSMTDVQATFACDPAGLLTNSRFWIENRDAAGVDIGAFVEKQKQLLRAYNKAIEDKDSVRAGAIAGEYNALTDKWGFE